MKQYIYFDKERIESLVAQISGGIDDSFQISQERGHGDEIEKSESVKGNVEGGINVFGTKIGGAVAGEDMQSKRNSDNELFREIHNKRLHDFIFDNLVSHLESTNKFNPSEMKAGSFIKDKDSLQIIDFEYLESFFKENSVISFLKDTQEKEILNSAKIEQEKRSMEKMSNEQKRKNEAEIKKMVTEEIYQMKEQYIFVEKIIGAIKAIIPYNRMALSSKGFLMPLEDKCFRDNPNLLGLKYGGSFHYIGYITNIIDANTKTEDNKNVFGEMQKAVNEVLLKLLPTDVNKIYILHPLGLYFES